MIWTTTPPTEPGWYWVDWGIAIDAHAIVGVVYVDCRWQDPSWTERLPTSQWAGPLVPPPD
jgi:hypothetical protein